MASRLQADRLTVAAEDEDVRSIIFGVFDIRVKVTEIAEDVRAIRREFLDEDGEEEAEEDH
jgi:hypothetical protein